eukprot:gene3958-2821_t
MYYTYFLLHIAKNKINNNNNKMKYICCFRALRVGHVVPVYLYQHPNIHFFCFPLNTSTPMSSLSEDHYDAPVAVSQHDSTGENYLDSDDFQSHRNDSNSQVALEKATEQQGFVEHSDDSENLPQKKNVNKAIFPPLFVMCLGERKCC